MGFKVDENGFFGTDMNKATGIPDNVKIHQKQLEMTETYTKAIGSNDDPVTALSKVRSFFSKVAGNTLDIGLRTFFGEQATLGDDISNIKGLYQNYVSPTYDGNESNQQIFVGELIGVFCLSEMSASADTHENIQNYYSFLKSGQDFQSYLSNKFGVNYVKDLADGMNAHFKDSNMFDTLLKEINQAMKENYTSYVASNNNVTDSILNKNDTTAQFASSSKYQTMKNTKLPISGNLINIATQGYLKFNIV